METTSLTRKESREVALSHRGRSRCFAKESSGFSLMTIINNEFNYQSLGFRFDTKSATILPIDGPCLNPCPVKP